VDEADIGDVKKGERVTFTVDAYPDDTFAGEVTQVRQEATTTNNVVTYEVVISAPNGNLKLKPGLTANVTIYTQEMKGVLSVPSKALRFTPSKDLIGKGDKIKDCKGINKLWTREGNVIKANEVKIGLSDGTRTQIIDGIPEGAVVITDISVNDNTAQAADGSTSEQSPFAPGPHKSDKSKSGTTQGAKKNQ